MYWQYDQAHTFDVQKILFSSLFERLIVYFLVIYSKWRGFLGEDFGVFIFTYLLLPVTHFDSL